MATWTQMEDVVPQSYDEMVRVYRTYVTRCVMKHNQVATNTEDLVQHVWTKLFEVDVIAKYNKSLGRMPKQLTSLQAASYLGMTFPQWKVCVWRGLFGDKKASSSTISRPVKDAVFARDHGICSDASHETPFDTIALERLLIEERNTLPETYRQTREQLKAKYGISTNERVFWAVDRIPGSTATGIEKYRTTCLFCMARRREEEGLKEVPRRKNDFTPRPIQGGWASKKAIFDLVEIERFKMFRETLPRIVRHKEIRFEMPTTRCLFQMYLARSVHNIYSNWCRTRFRKYKELYQPPLEDGTAWESTLGDYTSGSQEAKVLLNEQVNEDFARILEKVQKRIAKDGITQEDIISKLQDGWSISEVLKEYKLPRNLLQNVEGRYGLEGLLMPGG